MRLNLLEILQCPYCGASFDIDAGPNLRRSGEEIEHGVLRCQCATYPVVDGIPVLLAGYGGDGDFQRMLANEPERALQTMLDLDDARQSVFRRLLAQGEEVSYREWVGLFSPGNEGPYFIHRFANPTFLVGQAILRAVANDRRLFSRRVIDLCGGAGHLARSLCQLSGGAEVVLTETNYWKLWLARRIVAPQCAPVCCDSEAPLPFKRGAFSLALCSDAFHYVWSKRMLACEMIRLAGDDGVIILNHVHNSLCENFSAGLPLAPEWWRNLFAEIGVRVFKETEVLDSVLDRREIDLTRDYSNEELSDEQALFLIATRLKGLYRTYADVATQPSARATRLNPLYQLTPEGENEVLQLNFPSPQYETEFGACKRYLPERVELPAGTLRKIEAGQLDGAWREIAERYVLLDLPDGY